MKKDLLFILTLICATTNVFAQNDINTLFVTQDTYVRGGTSSDENYGDLPKIEIKNGSSNPSFLRDAYLQFNLDDFTSVVSARLLIYGSAQDITSIGAYESSQENWSENTINWDNKPTRGDLISSSTITIEEAWVELDITALVQDRIGELLTVIISDPEASNNSIFLRTKEEGYGQFKARLVIEGESSLSVPKDIYLVIGQSNTAGRGKIEEQDEDTLDGVFLFNDAGGWEPARNPANGYSTVRKRIDLQGLGYASNFARRTHEVTGNNIGLVVNARGGTNISAWTKGNEAGYYKEALSRLEAALSLPNTTFKGILWHQGESDRDNSNYLSELEGLINSWRNELNMPEMPFIAGQLSPLRDDNVPFNENLLTLPTLVDHTGVVTSEDLTTIIAIPEDLTHFNSESQRILGVRNAEVALKLIYGIDTDNVANNVFNQIYYIDDENGNDSNSGFTQTTAWKTLANINSTTFLPGNQILFKAGGSWSGTIMPAGSGAAGNPIVIGKYGNGANPILNGDAKVNCSIDPSKTVYCTIGLSNQEYWEINDLEITNYDPSEENGKTLEQWESDNKTQFADVEMPPPYAGVNSLKCGILVEANNFGSVDYLHFNNLEVHGVNGYIEEKDNGGIFFEIYDFGNETPTYFNDLLINNCHIHDVDRTGISNASDYSTRSLNTSVDWTPSLNYRVTNTTFERTGANAMIMRVADAPILENCLFDHCGIKESGNAAFFFNVDGGIMQFNEFRFTKANVGDRDAGGPDIDFRTKDCILQYNYLHDNDNGLLVTGGADPDSDRFNDNAIVRYNVIERDGRQPHPSDDKFVLKITGKATNGVFHNNIIYIGEDQSDIKINRSRARSGAAPENTSYHNNIIYNLGTNSIHDYDASTNNTMSHNLYFGNSVGLATNETNKIVGDPIFDAVGNGPDGYRINDQSPAVAAGLSIASIPSEDYYGNTIVTNIPVDIGIHQFNTNPDPCATNQSPTVSLSLSNATGEAPAAVTLTANASDEDGSITSVEFYQDDILIDTKVSAPYSITVNDLQVGSYNFTAVTVDDCEAQTTSNIEEFVVVAPDPCENNSAPLISLSLSDATGEAPAAVTLTANASDEDGSITSVEFYQDDILIDTKVSAPYSITVNDLQVGSYNFTAVTVDDCEAQTTSNSEEFVVVAPDPCENNSAPLISLSLSDTTGEAPAAVTLTANASDVDGEITKVEFYQDGNLITTDENAPYILTVDNLQVASYNFTAVTVDDCEAQTTSNSEEFVVVAPDPCENNSAPLISLSLSNATGEAPAAVTLTANASDEDGSIISVEFYQDDILITTDESAPYEITVNDLQVATYNFTAVTVDDCEAQTTSNIEEFVVVAPDPCENNSAPLISLSLSNTTGEAPAAVTLTANASDEDGSITSVEFYQDDILIDTKVSAPYSITVNDLQVGSYNFTAVTIDDCEAQTTSNSEEFVVVAPDPCENNSAPLISLSLSNATGEAPAAVTLTANASDEDGSIISVEFYQDDILIDTKVSAPYSITVNDLQVGSYNFTAVTIDDCEAQTTSNSEEFVVIAPDPCENNSAPLISLSLSNTTGEAPAAVTLTANASDEDGSITSVEFYQDDILIDTVEDAPYEITVNDLQVATYNFTAVTVDDCEAQTTSNIEEFVVVAPDPCENNSAPLISLSLSDATGEAPAAVILTANASDEDGSITSVEFYQDDILIATEVTAPYEITVNDLQVATYNFTAVTVDDCEAQTTSNSEEFVVVAPDPCENNSAPLISLSLSNATGEAPAAVTLTANASDEDGSITSVEFYQDDILIDTIEDAPYEITVNDLQVATYNFTAVTVDDCEAQTTSNSEEFIVVAPDPCENNSAPLISLSLSNATGEAPAAVTLTANASDEDGEITKVEFYQDDTLIGTEVTAPYEITVNNIEEGTYNFTAVTIDDCDAQTTSNIEEFVVVAPDPCENNSAPLISLSLSDATGEAPAVVTLTANASDEDGSIISVEFYQDDILIATKVSAPYEITVNDIEEGTYNFTAVTIDDCEAQTTSNSEEFVVIAPDPCENNSAPLISLSLSNATGEAPASITLTANASDEDGEIIKVEFYQDDTLIATEVTAPYEITVNDLQVATYNFTAVTVDDCEAQSTSNIEEFVVVAPDPCENNSAPLISLSLSDATGEAPAAVTLTANASDEDGSIISVEFYQDDILIDTKVSAPYEITVNDLQVGSYNFTAVTIDDCEAQITSNSEEFIVVAPDPCENNSAPLISLSLSNATGEAPAAVTLTANASDEDGSIISVEFYQDDILIATKVSAPYSITVNNIEEGTYNFTAVTVDDCEAQTTSNSEEFVVVAPDPCENNSAPLISLSLSNTTGEAPAVVTLTANASDEDGEITKVEFYQDDILIATEVTAPYEITVNDLQVGSYNFTAVTVDDCEAQTTSNIEEFIVVAPDPCENNSAPLISLSLSNETQTSVSLTADASDTDGTITKVEFYQNGDLIAIDRTAPYTTTVDDLQEGTYNFTAITFDKCEAQTTSNSKEFVVPEIITTEIDGIIIYPNPTSTGYVKIDSSSKEQISVKIFDTKGRNLGNSILRGDNKLDVRKFSPGLYYLEITQNNNTSVKKLIVR